MGDLREPDVTGAVARAWRSKAQPVEVSQQASICSWVINGPFHPAWSWWVISAISLADIDGVPSAVKHYPEAEFEILILSLNPDHCPPDPDAADLKPLTPPDLVYQFHGVAEFQVEEIVSLMVREITEGRMSPDSDYRRSWEGSLRSTVQHYRERLH